MPLGLGLWYTFSGLITYWAMAGTVPLSTSLQYLVLTLLPLHKLHGSIKTGLQKEAVLVGGSWAADEMEVTWDAFKLHIQLDSAGNITAATLRRAVHLTFLEALASEPAETATLQLRGQQLDWPASSASSSSSALPSDLSSPPTVSRSYDRSLDLSSSNRDSLDRTTGRAFDRQTPSPNSFDRPPVPPRAPAFNLLALCEPRLAAKLADIDIGAHGLLFDDGPSDYTHFEEIDTPRCSQSGTGQTVERPSLPGTPVGLVFAEPEPGRSDEVLDPPIPIRSTLEARKKKIAGLDLRMLIPVSFWSFGKAPEGVDISEPLPPGVPTTVDSPLTFISSPTSSTASPVGLHSSTPPPLPPRSSTFPASASTPPPPIVLPRESTTSSTPTTSTIAESAGEMDGPPSLLLTKSEQTLDVDIKGGTLLELTYSLFSPPSGVSRNSVEEVFLYTYTSFTNPHQLLQLLLSLYDESESEPNPGVFRLRLCGFMVKWLKEHHQNLSPVDVQQVVSFANSKVAQNEGEVTQSRLLASVQPTRARSMSEVMHSSPPPKSHLPPPPPFTFMQINPVELARQLTLQFHTAYRRITPVECMISSFTGKEREARSPNLTRLTEQFNLLSYWVASSIVSFEDLSARAMSIEYFISCATELRVLQNFMSINAILAGINSTPVRRLTETWKRVPKSKSAAFTKLREEMASNKNFANYRRALEDCVPPLCPYVGTFLTDLVFIEEGNPDFLKDFPDLINFSKRRQTAKVVQQILCYTKEPYNLEAIPSILTFLDNLEYLSEDQRYELSRKIQPRLPAS